MIPMRATFLALLGLASCEQSVDPLAPLLGQWTSSDPRLAGCTLTFAEGGYLTLWNAEEHSETCSILAVETETDGTLAVIYETAEGTEDRLELTLLENGTVKMRNQEHPWQRR